MKNSTIVRSMFTNLLLTTIWNMNEKKYIFNENEKKKSQPNLIGPETPVRSERPKGFETVIRKRNGNKNNSV